MKYRPLGNTGMQVSEIGFGADAISGQGIYGVTDEADGIAAVQRAYELGVTFYDTAESYCEGRSEEVVGKVLGNKPDVVICTKVSARGEGLVERMRSAAEGSLRRLQRDAIDVYLLHNPSTAQIADPAVQEALKALQADGLVRTYGVSCVTALTLEQGEETLRQGGYTSMQVPLNIFQRQIVDELLPRSEEAGVGIAARVPLASGLLSGKYTSATRFAENDARGNGTVPREQVERELEKVPALVALADEQGVSLVQAALAWVLTHSGVSTTIPGAKNTAQAESNSTAGDVSLAPKFLEYVRSLR